MDLSHLVAMTNLGSEEERELEKEMGGIEKKMKEWETHTFLSGEYDERDALLTIRSGAGGTDAQDWAEMLLRMYIRYAEQHSFKTSVLDESRGGEAGLKSVTVEMSGRYAYGFLRGEAGVHRLIRLSPFNADHLRQTSFASVEVLPVTDEVKSIIIRPEDLRVDTFRASGAGGQHVNKTESAIRITHLPTNTVVSVQSERSQLQNREQAMKILRGKLLQHALEEKEREEARLRGKVKPTAFGHQIRTYTLHPYTLVKDHRTGIETTAAQKVLEGDLDNFIQGALEYRSRG